MVIKLKMPINLFPNKKNLFNKSWKSTCQSGIWYDVLFKGFYNFKDFYKFWHYRISNTFESKKKTDRARGAIEVDNVAQSDLSTKILVCTPIDTWVSTELWNRISISIWITPDPYQACITLFLVLEKKECYFEIRIRRIS